MTKKNQMYFAANPDAKHDEHLVDYHIDDIDLKFTTDAGVFSKLRIDYGSGVLIKTMKDLTFPKAGMLEQGMVQWAYLQLNFGQIKKLIWST